MCCLNREGPLWLLSVAGVIDNRQVSRDDLVISMQQMFFFKSYQQTCNGGDSKTFQTLPIIRSTIPQDMSTNLNRTVHIHHCIGSQLFCSDTSYFNRDNCCNVRFGSKHQLYWMTISFTRFVSNICFILLILSFKIKKSRFTVNILYLFSLFSNVIR